MKLKTLFKIFKYLKRHLFLIIISMICAIITVISSLLVPYLFGITIDYIVNKTNVYFDKIIDNSIIILLLIGITAISQWIMNLVNNKIVYKLVSELRNDAFNKLSKVPISYIDNNQSGKIINTIIVDTEQFGDGLLMALTQFFTGVLTIVGVLILMLIINPFISIFVFVLTPISLFVAKWISSNSYTSFKAQSLERGIQTSLIDELIGNQKVVQAFSYEDDAYNRFVIENEVLAKISLKATFISSLVNPSTRVINAIIYAGVALIGSLLCITDSNFAISIGGLTCLLGYANQYTKPFNEITGVITELQNSIACASNVFSLIEENEESSIDKKLNLDNNISNIKINDLSFSYTPTIPLINNFNLNINHGNKVAIVGPTGCGKTTLINLLMRFYDRIDGDILINGESIYNYSRESLRLNYGMVLQDTWIKNGTIYENITMGKPNASMDEVISACKDAKIYHFIKQLPNGFNTIISDNDSILSQGQKQLLCIARVMITSPSILILDEATSNIDTRTELLVQKAFDKLMENKTSFIVAHRLSTIKDADIIIVMKNGSIIETGNHKNLLEKKGFNYELYNSQFNHSTK